MMIRRKNLLKRIERLEYDLKQLTVKSDLITDSVGKVVRIFKPNGYSLLCHTCNGIICDYTYHSNAPEIEKHFEEPNPFNLYIGLQFNNNEYIFELVELYQLGNDEVLCRIENMVRT